MGTVKVFGSAVDLVDSVTVTSKRAMAGAKLAVSSSSNSTRPTTKASTYTPGYLLTEIVVLRKTALKKVIANGWADVVVSDHVLFTKAKSDYPFKWW